MSDDSVRRGRLVDPLDPDPSDQQRWSVDLEVPERALVVAAHPDDVDFHAGATVAKWSAAGCCVSYVVCTDGSKGTWDPGVDRAELVHTRQLEQRAAAAAAGASGQVVFLGWPDGELDSGLRQRSQVASWIRRLRPDVVLGHDPWKRYRLHPDHRNAGFLAVDGVVAARDPLFFDEHALAHHRPQAILLFEPDEPDHAEDVTGFDGAKIAAIESHASQFETTLRISDDDAGEQRSAFRERVRGRLVADGQRVGVTHAEVYKLITRV